MLSFFFYCSVAFAGLQNYISLPDRKGSGNGRKLHLKSTDNQLQNNKEIITHKLEIKTEETFFFQSRKS